MIKFRRLRWAGHVATMEEGMRALYMLIGKHVNQEGIGLNCRRILEWILRNWRQYDHLDWIDSGQKLLESSCECSNETSGSIGLRVGFP